jgi:uncharacterized protein (DUF305 family)
MTTKKLAVSALVCVVAGVIAGFLLATYIHRQAAPMATAEAPAGHAGHAISPPGTGPMGTAPTGDANKDFAQEMIVHHEAAVDMSKELLAKGSDPELKALAENIIQAQTKEIEFLRAWLAKQPKP